MACSHACAPVGHQFLQITTKVCCLTQALDTICVPRARIHKRMSEAASTDLPPRDTHRPRPRLLLVSGRPADLKPVTGLLSGDFSLSFATDGLSGVHRTQSLLPDLVLMDTDLPGVVDGLVACRLLRADRQTQGIPVMLFSDRNEPADRVCGFEAGAVDYVGQPLWPPEVLARVRVHLPAARPAEPAPADPDEAHVSAACALIQRQLAALPGVEELARQVGVTGRRLRALFRRHLQVTLQEYIAEQRIRASFRLLEKTTMSVNSVAFEVGFSSPGNFSTAFRTRTGVTPLAWRRQRSFGF